MEIERSRPYTSHCENDETIESYDGRLNTKAGKSFLPGGKQADGNLG